MDGTQFGTEASEEHMGLLYKDFYGSVTGNQMKPHTEAHAVSDIVSGLCESIKNVHNHRLFLHEEIKDILKRQRTYQPKVFMKED